MRSQTLNREISATSGAAVLPVHGLQACGNVGKAGPLVGQRLPAVADERRQRRWRVARDVRPQAPMHDRQRRLYPADACIRHLHAHARIAPSASRDQALQLQHLHWQQQRHAVMQELVCGMHLIHATTHQVLIKDFTEDLGLHSTAKSLDGLSHQHGPDAQVDPYI